MIGKSCKVGMSGPEKFYKKPALEGFLEPRIWLLIPAAL
jgi:hypothetical protein